MEIKNLYTLKTILEEGSFAGAANRMSYTQSTITFQIHQLEQELGVTLFEKVGRRMMLTKEGERILPFVNETIAAFEKLQNIGRTTEQLEGEINVIISETLLCYRMQKIISTFHERAPKVKLKFRTMSCYATKQAIVDGSADIGICYDEQTPDERLKIFPLENTHLCLVASAKLQELLGKEVLDFTKENCVIDTSFVTDEPDGIFRGQFEDYLKKQRISLNSTIELWNTETIKSLVKSNMGVAFLPDFAVEQELKDGTFVELEQKVACEKTRAIYFYHKNKYVNKPMELLMECIEKENNAK